MQSEGQGGTAMAGDCMQSGALSASREDAVRRTTAMQSGSPHSVRASPMQSGMTAPIPSSRPIRSHHLARRIKFRFHA